MRQGYATTNGIRIFFVEEGEGPLVLLLHGLPEQWYSWRHQMQPIADAGFRCVAIDLPGFGRSDKPDVTYDMDFLTATVDGLITSLGHEEAIVAGHDWGGLILWPFVRRYPHRVRGAIGLNTADVPRTPIRFTDFLREMSSGKHQYILDFQERYVIDEQVAENPEAFVRSFLLGPATVQKQVFTDDVVEVYVDAVRPRGAITPMLEYYRNMDRNWELAEAYDHIKVEVPTLMIGADSDLFLPPALMDFMDDRVTDLTKVV
ncbi:MAG: alpha/beta fold hydrolase, partial [Actinomycetota bacterium]